MCPSMPERIILHPLHPTSSFFSSHREKRQNVDQIYAKQAIISHLNFREFQWIRSHIRKCADQQVKGSTFDQGKKKGFSLFGDRSHQPLLSTPGESLSWVMMIPASFPGFTFKWLSMKHPCRSPTHCTNSLACTYHLQWYRLSFHFYQEKRWSENAIQNWNKQELIS